MSSSLLVSFTGALQAALSVLLTLSAGVGAARFGLIDDQAAKKVSRLCVELFLPALLIVNVGKEIGKEGNDKGAYGSVLLWSLLYTLLSALVGNLSTRALRLPAWITPAICFNNTTSLPLLLVQSLQTSGFLSSIIKGGSESEAVNRAKSFFLINALTSNSLTFAIGPALLEYGAAQLGMSDHFRDLYGDTDRDSKPKDENNTRDGYIEEDDEDTQHDVERNGDSNNHHDHEESTESTEQTSLLSTRVTRPVIKASKKSKSFFMTYFSKLPKSVQNALSFIAGMVNAPLIGAIIALFIGLTPPLHTAFFADPDKGGIFTSWLTSAIQNLGDLFTALQMFVVGTKLNKALVAKFNVSGEDGDDDDEEEEDQGDSTVPKRGVALVFILRFIVWSVLSNLVIYLLASKTTLLGKDPILWFAMMLMPVGPPAIILASLAEYKNEKEGTKLAISKMLCLQYLLTPLMCFPVVGALKLTQKILEEKGMN